uniref:Uncharacterized protein n=1 Tax=Human herpesvirus 2 TaxID=10310 RepID=A0A481TAP0_HHV2|nr:hypothetical protein [Human alphaherpesvirus 2]
MEGEGMQEEDRDSPSSALPSSVFPLSTAAATPPFLRPPASPRTPPPRVSPIVHHRAPHRALAVWGVAAVVGVLPEAAGAE